MSTLNAQQSALNASLLQQKIGCYNRRCSSLSSTIPAPAPAPAPATAVVAPNGGWYIDYRAHKPEGECTLEMLIVGLVVPVFTAGLYYAIGAITVPTSFINWVNGE